MATPSGRNPFVDYKNSKPAKERKEIKREHVPSVVKATYHQRVNLLQKKYETLRYWTRKFHSDKAVKAGSRVAFHFATAIGTVVIDRSSITAYGNKLDSELKALSRLHDASVKRVKIGNPSSLKGAFTPVVLSPALVSYFNSSDLDTGPVVREDIRTAITKVKTSDGSSTLMLKKTVDHLLSIARSNFLKQDPRREQEYLNITASERKAKKDAGQKVSNFGFAVVSPSFSSTIMASPALYSEAKDAKTGKYTLVPGDGKTDAVSILTNRIEGASLDERKAKATDAFAPDGRGVATRIPMYFYRTGLTRLLTESLAGRITLPEAVKDPTVKVDGTPGRLKKRSTLVTDERGNEAMHVVYNLSPQQSALVEEYRVVRRFYVWFKARSDERQKEKSKAKAKLDAADRKAKGIKARKPTKVKFTIGRDSSGTPRVFTQEVKAPQLVGGALPLIPSGVVPGVRPASPGLIATSPGRVQRPAPSVVIPPTISTAPTIPTIQPGVPQPSGLVPSLVPQVPRPGVGVQPQRSFEGLPPPPGM